MLFKLAFAVILVSLICVYVLGHNPLMIGLYAFCLLTAIYMIFSPSSTKKPVSPVTPKKQNTKGGSNFTPEEDRILSDARAEAMSNYEKRGEKIAAEIIKRGH